MLLFKRKHVFPRVLPLLLYFIHTVLYKLLTAGEYSGGTLLDHKSQPEEAP